MVDVREHIKQVNTAHKAVLDHPMCFDLEEHGYFYIAYFPNMVDGVGGVRVYKEQGKAKALTQLLSKLEHYWKRDNPVLYPNYK